MNIPENNIPIVNLSLLTLLHNIGIIKYKNNWNVYYYDDVFKFFENFGCDIQIREVKAPKIGEASKDLYMNSCLFTQIPTDEFDNKMKTIINEIREKNFIPVILEYDLSVRLNNEDKNCYEMIITTPKLISPVKNHSTNFRGIISDYGSIIKPHDNPSDHFSPIHQNNQYDTANFVLYGLYSNINKLCQDVVKGLLSLFLDNYLMSFFRYRIIAESKNNNLVDSIFLLKEKEFNTFSKFSYLILNRKDKSFISGADTELYLSVNNFLEIGFTGKLNILNNSKVLMNYLKQCLELSNITKII